MFLSGVAQASGNHSFGLDLSLYLSLLGLSTVDHYFNRRTGPSCIEMTNKSFVAPSSGLVLLRAYREKQLCTELTTHLS